MNECEPDRMSCGAAIPSQRAIFFDRDGTLIEEGPFLSDPHKIRFLPGVPEALKALKESGFRLILVTNQSGVGRGYFSREALELIHKTLQELLEENGAAMDAIYFCPHAPEAECACRKPKPALFQQAVAEHHLDPKQSYAMGDALRDLIPAKEMGCKTVFISTNSAPLPEKVEADHVAVDFSDAATWILEDFRRTFPSS